MCSTIGGSEDHSHGASSNGSAHFVTDHALELKAQEKIYVIVSCEAIRVFL